LERASQGRSEGSVFAVRRGKEEYVSGKKKGAGV
jgi:hypothetical protein